MPRGPGKAIPIGQESAQLRLLPQDWNQIPPRHEHLGCDRQPPMQPMEKNLLLLLHSHHHHLEQSAARHPRWTAFEHGVEVLLLLLLLPQPQIQKLPR